MKIKNKYRKRKWNIENRDNEMGICCV